jgi:histidinol dehydrogenase
MTPDLHWTGPLAALDADDEDAILDRAATVTEDTREKVARIEDVFEEDGDDALVAFTKRFDDVELDELTVPREAWVEALDEAPPGFEEAFEAAVGQVRAYHETLSARASSAFRQGGIAAHERAEPVPRAGLYVPGGDAAYPSTVAMTVVPARVAGVTEVTVASPPAADGRPHPMVLAACELLDVDRLVPVGGAQAIFALARGSATLPAHEVVAGPGNAFVQAAKERVAGEVRIDAPAGPSEVAALVGPEADPRVAARELAAQAEHDPSSQAIALAHGERTAQDVKQALGEVVPELDREATVREALASNGGVLTVGSLAEAAGFLDRLAPEHCVLLHEDGDELADELIGPACIVHGARARVPLTDYAAGPSHVLPTGGSARAYSGIDLETFTKRVHVVDAEDPAPELVEAARTLARLEGMTAHAAALEDDGP